MRQGRDGRRPPPRGGYVDDGDADVDEAGAERGLADYYIVMMTAKLMMTSIGSTE